MSVTGAFSFSFKKIEKSVNSFPFSDFKSDLGWLVGLGLGGSKI